MMKRDFKKWHNNKEKIDDRTSRIFFHEREIWWCSLGANVGFEQDGKGEKFARPVLIFKKFNNEIFWAIPLSTKMKKNKYYISLSPSDAVKRVAIISQLRLIDAKRLLDKIAVINRVEYGEIQKAVISLCS